MNYNGAITKALKLACKSQSMRSIEEGRSALRTLQLAGACMQSMFDCAKEAVDFNDAYEVRRLIEACEGLSAGCKARTLRICELSTDPELREIFDEYIDLHKKNFDILWHLKAMEFGFGIDAADRRFVQQFGVPVSASDRYAAHAWSVMREFLASGGLNEISFEP